MYMDPKKELYRFKYEAVALKTFFGDSTDRSIKSTVERA